MNRDNVREMLAILRVFPVLSNVYPGVYPKGFLNPPKLPKTPAPQSLLQKVSSLPPKADIYENTA
jgi:hypothetical protein